jgi:hypothetical protein
MKQIVDKLKSLESDPKNLQKKFPEKTHFFAQKKFLKSHFLKHFPIS